MKRTGAPGALGIRGSKLAVSLPCSLSIFLFQMSDTDLDCYGIYPLYTGQVKISDTPPILVTVDSETE